MTSMAFTWTGGREVPEQTVCVPGKDPALGGGADRDGANLIEASKFNEIMEVVGPDGREEFLDCLVNDLSDLARSLDHAIRAHDADEALRKTHALIGLAGTLGVDPLRDMARAMHRDAADQVACGLTSLGAQTLAELDRLIRFFKGGADPERLA